MAITLAANTFIGGLTNLVAQGYVLDNYKGGGALTSLLNAFRGSDVETADGLIIASAGLPTVSALDNTGATSSITAKVIQSDTATDLDAPYEQRIAVSAWKYIKLTINEYLMKGAFTKEFSMANLVAYLMKTMQDAKMLHMYNFLTDGATGIITDSMADEITAATTGHIVSITGIAAASGDTVQDKLAKATYNTTKYFKQIIEEIKQFELGQKRVWKNKDDAVGRKTIENGNDFIVLIDPKLYASLDVDALAVLLNSAKITDDINVQFIQMNTVNGSNTRAPEYSLLCTKDTFKYGFNYQVATSFFDPSNLNTHNWLHFSYYGSRVDFAPYEIIKLTNFSFDL